MQTVTLRKINADKKLLDRKLTNFRNDLSNGNIAFSGFMLASKKRIGDMTDEQFVEKCKSNWQSFCDLVKRRDYLNCVNILYFGGKSSLEGEETYHVVLPKFNGCAKFDKSVKETITIAQAIGRKNFLKDNVIPFLSAFKLLAIKTIDAYDKAVEIQKEKLMKQVNQQFGAESPQNAAERMKYQENLMPIYEVAFLDPLNIKETVTTILDQMEEYLVEIDSAISRATETTEVEIED